MTPFRHFSENQKFTNRLRQGGLYVAVAALLATPPSPSFPHGPEPHGHRITRLTWSPSPFTYYLRVLLVTGLA